MLFSSMLFLWLFLPAVLVGNFLLSVLPFHSQTQRIQWKNGFLLLASLVFYGAGGWRYLLLMVGVIGINYLGGLAVGKMQTPDSPGMKGSSEENSGRSPARLPLLLTLALDLGILFVFKYLGMFADVNIILPIGISFYTFQAISYVVDVYRGKCEVQKNPFYFALYVSLFPQLIAGPIVQYADIREQLTQRKESEDAVVEGIRRFCYGLGKKVLLANTFGEVADMIWKMEVSRIGGGIAWLGMVTYTLQIYYDFSGYSDMAIGLGRMLGFSFRENFNYPYISKSVQEFWRRWHMSLSSFFREYVYIPLGGNRRGLGRTCVNVLIVFALTGIWHGANYTFWAWGLYYGVLLVLQRLWQAWRKTDSTKTSKPLAFLQWAVTMFLVMVGWVIFRSDSLGQAFTYFSQLFQRGGGTYSILSCLSPKLLIALPLGILGSGWLQHWTEALWKKTEGSIRNTCDFVFQMVLLFASICLIISGTYNPFIYFQF